LPLAGNPAKHIQNLSIAIGKMDRGFINMHVRRHFRIVKNQKNKIIEKNIRAMIIKQLSSKFQADKKI
jgi:hypothetical protein